MNLKEAHKHLWLLDCGKGIQDPLEEAHESPKLPDGRKLNEGEFSRDLTQRVLNLCESYRLKAKLLATASNGWSELNRADTANAYLAQDQNCVLISIRLNRANHGESNIFTSSTGVSAYYFHKDQTLWSWITEPSWSKSSKILARLLLEYLCKATGFSKRGIKKNKHPLLRALKMPAVILRCGFLQNQKEVSALLDPKVRQKIAEHVVQAMLEVEGVGIADLNSSDLPFYRAANQS